MKKQIIFFMTLFFTVSNSYAYDFKNNDIYYSISYIPNQVAVCFGTDSYKGNIIIPESVTNNGIKYTVTDISSYAFYQCPNLISVTIPNSVTSIGEGAFAVSQNLTTVNLPSNIKTIRDYTFSACNSLTSIFIPNSVQTLEDHAFYACIKLNSITLSNAITDIGNWTFYGCISLTSIYIPDKVQNIGQSAFENCYSLESIFLPASVINLGFNTFSFCRALTSINIDVNNNNYSSFEGVLFDKNMRTIIKLPEAFTGSYTMPNTVVEINDLAFSNCKKLSSIIFSNKLDRIRDAVFIHCTGLTSIHLPSSITSIGYSAFNNCANLTTINIPESLTFLGNTAFQDCVNLKSIYAQSKVPVQLDNERYNAFIGVLVNTCILYVPVGSKKIYENTPQWWDFQNILELTTENKDIKESQIGIRIRGNTVIFNDLKKNEIVRIFSHDGKMIYTMKSESLSNEVQLPEKNIYIVKVGNNCIKIVL